MSAKSEDHIDYEIHEDRAYPVIMRIEGANYTDKCPYCGDNHVHSIGEGHRAAHCSNRFERNLTYTTEDKKHIIPVSRGYFIREYKI